MTVFSPKCFDWIGWWLLSVEEYEGKISCESIQLQKKMNSKPQNGEFLIQTLSLVSLSESAGSLQRNSHISCIIEGVKESHDCDNCLCGKRTFVCLLAISAGRRAALPHFHTLRRRRNLPAKQRHKTWEETKQDETIQDVELPNNDKIYSTHIVVFLKFRVPWKKTKKKNLNSNHVIYVNQFYEIKARISSPLSLMTSIVMATIRIIPTILRVKTM